jgi:antibiotic biosynthesis monooxygenase
VATTGGEKTLELVVFHLKGGVTREQFLATDEAAARWMREQPGFISHELSQATDGERWIEVAWWESREQAEAAAEAAMSSESCAPMFALIDMESALMLHGELAAATLPPGVRVEA